MAFGGTGAEWGSSLGGIGGAALGSIFPVVGTAIGGAAGTAAGGGIGALVDYLQSIKKPQQGNQGSSSSLGSFFGGNPSGFEQVSPFSPEQQGIMQQLAQLGLLGQQNPYSGFEGIEKYAQSQFENQILPSIAERFSAFGSNALSSPALAASQAAAGKDLALGLGAQRAQYGLQNQSIMQNLLRLGLIPQYENKWVEGTPGALEQITPYATKLGANALGSYLGAAPGKGGSEAWSAIINGLKGA